MSVGLPDAYWDMVLLRLFPNRTLEELDAISWPRLMRALQVREIERIEDRMPDFFAGKWQPTAAEWGRIRWHDTLYDALERVEVRVDRLNEDIE